MDVDTNIEAGGDKGGDKSGTVEFPKWMSSLPDAYKQDERFKSFEEPSKAWDKFASLIDAEGKTIAIPDEKATDEDRAAFLTKLGRPEKAEEYDITKPKDYPEGLPYDAKFEAVFKETAFKEGLPKQAASNLWNWYLGLSAQGYAEQQKEEQKVLDDAVNTLKNEWKGDDYKKNINLAFRAYKEFGDDSTKKFIEETKIGGIALGNHPVILRLFASIAKSVMDDTASGEGMGSGGELSDEIKAEKRFSNTKWKK